MRQVNVSRILEAIQAKGVLSRADIARITGLSRPAVSDAVAALLERRVLVEVGKGASRGGKRPTLLTFNSEAGYVLAVHADGQGLRAGVHGLTGVPMKPPLRWEGRPGTGEAAVEAILAAVHALSPEGLGSPVWGLGVAVSGVVDASTGIVRSSAALGLEDYPLAAEIERRLGLPAHLFHDVDAILLGEATTGAVADCSHALCVHTAEGVGASLLIDGRIYRGAHQAAGEIGASVLGWPSARRSQSFGDLDLAVRRLRSAHDGEADRAALVVAVANAVALLDPEAVVLSGWIRDRPDFIRDLERALGHVAEREVPVILASLGDDAALVGAAMGVVRQREEWLSLHPLR